MQQYNVVMQTPLGNRRGVMTVQIAGRDVSGTLALFGHSQPFTGSIAADGQCTISGSFVTLLRTVQFSAVGTLTHGSVSLRMQGERNVFLLTGAASESREEVSL